jgi:hypothetical protein
MSRISDVVFNACCACLPNSHKKLRNMLPPAVDTVVIFIRWCFRSDTAS